MRIRKGDYGILIWYAYGTRSWQPWLSFGIHIDWQKKFLDIHFVWWIIEIGNLAHSEIKDPILASKVDAIIMKRNKEIEDLIDGVFK